MADPCSNIFPGFFQLNPTHVHYPSSTPSPHHPYVHNFINHIINTNTYTTTSSNSSSSSFFHYHHHQTTSSSSPPSPPLREALPLLSLSPTKQEDEEEHEQEDRSCTAMDVKDCRILHSKPKEEDGKEDETVTVALHIGLPSPSAGAMASVLSSSEITDKDQGDGGEDSGFLATRLNKGQYWIPTPSQILIGSTQFS